MDFHELVQAAQDEDPAQFAARFPNPFLLEEGRQEGSSPKKGSDHDLPAARRVFEVARRDREDGEVVIGRAPEADIAIADPAVDLRHAMLKRALAAWTVRDLHARGGTIVNGSRLPAGATLPISTGAKLGLGSKLTFRFLDAAGLHAELEVLSPKLGKAAHKMPGDWTQQLQAVEVSLEEAPRLPPPSRAQGFADTELVARCDPLPAVPLPRDREITIGRVPGNDLVLPHRSVSKEHASLMRVGDAVRVRDLGSANGVTIGGRRVHGEAFAEVDGPPIEIGPYEVVIAPAGAGHRAGERTEAIGTVGVRALLDTLPLSEFLQGVEFNKRTGAVGVEAPDGTRGEIVFVDGAPHRAAFGERRGDQAVIALLKLTQGRFSYVPSNEVSGPKEMSGTFIKLVFEASRSHDEGSLVWPPPGDA